MVFAFLCQCSCRPEQVHTLRLWERRGSRSSKTCSSSTSCRDTSCITSQRNAGLRTGTYVRAILKPASGVFSGIEQGVARRSQKERFGALGLSAECARMWLLGEGCSSFSRAASACAFSAWLPADPPFRLLRRLTGKSDTSTGRVRRLRSAVAASWRAGLLEVRWKHGFETIPQPLHTRRTIL